MKTLNFEKEKNFKIAFANNLNVENNYKYFKYIEETKFSEETSYVENNKYNTLDNLRKKKHFNRTSNIVWICKHCGYVHIGVDSPNTCPICTHSSSSFILQASNY